MSVLSRWVLMLLLCGTVGSAALSAVSFPAVAQSDDDLETVIVQLMADVAVLQTDVATLRAEVDQLRAQLAAAGASDTPGIESALTGNAPAGSWTTRSATARAVASCGATSGCAYKYDGWGTLTIGQDGTYTWQGPYPAGTYELFTRGTEGNLDIVLIGAGDLRCTATYYAAEALLEVRLPTCPGFIVESQFEPGVMQELDSGDIIFQPLR